jgi:hypothetical protein
MSGRALAVCGWLAWQVGRPFGRRRTLRRAVPAVLATLLVALAVVPIVLPLLDPQPQDVGVADVAAGAVTEPERWVRLRGLVVPLRESPTGRDAEHALLVDATDTLDAIVLRADDPVTRADAAVVTGRVTDAIVVVTEELPIEATVFGTPPTIVPDRVIDLDPIAKPERTIWWPLAIPPLLLAGLLLIGRGAGYPVFRRATEVDVLVTPLGRGERLPAAWGGQLGPNMRDLADPGASLLVVRDGPSGPVLTAQPLSDDGGPAPNPVTIGGGWSGGRIGYVHTASETVAALRVRAEAVDATFLFARRGERDRVAALIALDRD